MAKIESKAAKEKLATIAGGKSNMSESAYRRQLVRSAMRTKADMGEGDDVFSRQIEEEDPFGGFYDKENLLKPSYDFTRLYRIYEESDVLQPCVDAMELNVDGFGYQLVFRGDDTDNSKDSPEAKAQLVISEDFFDHINDRQSFMKIRKLMREDLEVLGNGGIEVVRNNANKVQMLFHAPFQRLRISSIVGDPIPVNVNVPRNGKVVQVRMRKYFRKFAQVDEYGKNLRWFKAFGDPRVMNYKTGEFQTTTKFKATEIWHHKYNFGSSVYGFPRWIGAVLQALGRHAAQFINYDLFENQGIPPMAVLVAGGVLTDESLKDLELIIRGLRGVENWNRVCILEATSEGMGIDDKSNVKLELKNLSEYRSEDMMFNRFLDTAKADVRHSFRLPDLYVGQSETFTHATAKAARQVAEEQIFIPEREDFDERVNNELMPEIGVDMWSYRSKGPRIVGSEEISRGVETFSKVGAFTVNHAIERANEAFNLQMSKFSEPWANYPMPIVLELVKQSRLKGIEEIAEKVQENLKQLPGGAPKPVASNQKLLPGVTKKMLKSDMFTADEQSLYRLLVGIQAAVEKGELGCETHPH